MEDFLLPRYEGDCLTNLLPSVQDRLAGRAPVIDIPKAEKYVVVLVDGFGWHQIQRNLADCEFVAGLVGSGRRLTTAVPSTTATALSCLGCGTPPGRHGVVGYSFFGPSVGKIVNALTWENGPEDVEAFRQVPTRFQELGAVGCACAAVTLARFEGSALTRTAFSGTTQFSVTAEGEPEHVVQLVADALAEHDVVYCYERLLDHTGHGHGVASWQWLDRLGAVDDLIAALAELSSPEVCILVTGDHGMVDVPAEHRVVAEDEGLTGGVLVGGEGRLRQLYCDDPATVAARWARHLGERAAVWRRQDAIDAGWFGPEVTATTADRIGDVLVAMRDDWAVMSTTFPGEFSIVGMHGSLTPEEMEVPLLILGGTQ